ncbi:MAG: hypothetical protein MRJ92_12770 [Nitrospira sp.]|nr:hypothetical protein [Nitrospira sp.]
MTVWSTRAGWGIGREVSLSYRRRLVGFAKTTPAIVQLERMVARSVDLVVYAAHSLEGYVKALRPTSMAIWQRSQLCAFRATTRVPARLRRDPTADSGVCRRDGCLVRLPLDGRGPGPAAASVSFVLIGPDELARQRLRPR